MSHQLPCLAVHHSYNESTRIKVVSIFFRPWQEHHRDITTMENAHHIPRLDSSQRHQEQRGEGVPLVVRLINLVLLLAKMIR